MKQLKNIIEQINVLPIADKIEAINEAKRLLHEISPFKSEPVDCVLWVKTENVVANDYNPNSVAPPEMELLRHSITKDGYTQPIVQRPLKRSSGRFCGQAYQIRTRLCAGYSR